MAGGIRDLLPRSTQNRKMNEAIQFAMECYREHKAKQDAANTHKIIRIKKSLAVAQAA
jgi:hypothetical protein